MRRGVAILVGTAVAILLAATPARAEIQAREVVGGLDQPVAFTFGSDGRIWYVEKSPGDIRIVDLDTDEDVLFVTVGSVTADG